MKKKIGLILCGVLVICCFFGCRKTYNLNKYTEDEVVPNKFIEIEEGSIIKYKGVVTSFEIGYNILGDEVYFYEIQPIYKGSNLKYAYESGDGLIVLSPLEEVNRNVLNFNNYLEMGDIVNIKGRKGQYGKYCMSEEFIDKIEEYQKFNYIDAEEIEVIGNVNKLLDDETIYDDDDDL